ncbi:MAG: C4-type zinc ribbon domain-containing protein [Deltaproteobacteria bacterium]|nr:C4-type zinc ribbon domain-containing protein [Deltaproteobacteria bacterium]
MKETIRTLIALQRLDNQLKKWRRVAVEGPEKLTLARVKLTALDAELGSVKAHLADNQRRRRELEAESTDLIERKGSNQTRQLKARNNEEYRAVLKEAESIAFQLAAREDELLALMEEAEKLEAKLPNLVKAQKAEAALFRAESASIEKEIAAGHAQEELAQVERTKLTESLPREALSRYMIVSKNRDGQAIAPVLDGLCQVCRLSVPPQLFNELQRNDKLLSCPNCARIIYWPDHPDLKPPTEDATSLEAHG